MKNNHKKYSFTLIEVIIAIAILAMAIVSFSLLINTASRRSLRAARRWEKTHLLTQAVEYFMLCESENPEAIDENIFPSEDYTVECSFDSPRGLAEDIEESHGGQALRAMKVVLKDKNGDTVDSVTIERIVKELDK